MREEIVNGLLQNISEFKADTSNRPSDRIKLFPAHALPKQEGDNSRIIRIDDKHSCTEELLSAFLSFTFKNRNKMKVNYEVQRLYKLGSSKIRGLKNESEIFRNFDSVVMEEYKIQKHYLVEDYILDVSQFMEDTLQEQYNQ